MGLGAQLWKVRLGEVSTSIEALRRDMLAHSANMDALAAEQTSLFAAQAARNKAVEELSYSLEPGPFTEEEIFGPKPGVPAPVEIKTSAAPTAPMSRITQVTPSTDRTGDVAKVALFIAGGMFGGYLLFQALGIGRKTARA